MANAVIVTDMLRCFIEPGHALYVGDHARKIIPNVQHLLALVKASPRSSCKVLIGADYSKNVKSIMEMPKSTRAQGLCK